MRYLLGYYLRTFNQVKLIGWFLLLTVPMLFAPFNTDDFFHLLMLGDNPPLTKPDDGSLWGLFSFIDNNNSARQLLMNNGVLPWWTADNFYFKFWRPLAELTHYADFHLATKSAFFAHLHNSFWFIGLIVMIHKLFLKLTNNHQLSLLALGLFALNGHHGATIEWIANRNALMAALFATASFYQHLLFREENRISHVLLASLFLTAGLLSSESAIAIGGFMFTYALALDKKGYIKGILALTPYLLLVIIWYLIYKSLGYGANGSSIHYVDIASMPKEFFWTALQRIPVYIFSAIFSTPAEIFPGVQFLFSESVAHYVLAGMIFSLLVVASIFWPLFKHNHLLQFAFCGAIIATIPFCSIINQDRLVLIPSIGFDLALAIILYQVIQARVILFQHHWLNKIVYITSCVLLCLHLLLSPLYLFAASTFMHTTSKHFEQGLLQINDNNMRNTRVILFRSSLDKSALLKAIRKINNRTIPDYVHLLASSAGTLRIQRTDEKTLKIRRDNGFVQGFEESFRDLSRFPFKQNDTVEMDGFIIRIVATNNIGQPMEIECIFSDSLDNPHWQFYNEFRGRGLQPVDIPAIGQHLDL